MGALDAGNEAEAIGQLRRTGLYPTQVVEKGKGNLKSAGGKKVKKPAKAKAKSKGAKGQSLFGGNKVKGRIHWVADAGAIESRLTTRARIVRTETRVFISDSNGAFASDLYRRCNGSGPRRTAP